MKIPYYLNKCLIVISLVLFLILTVEASDFESIKKNIGGARVLLGTKDTNKALDVLKNAITELKKLNKEEPDNTKIIFQLGLCNYYIGNDPEAINWFDKVIELDKTDSDPHFFKGIIARIGNRLDNAEEEFSIACKLSPNDYRIWYELGLVLNQKNEIDRSIEAYKKSLSLNPENIQASYALARVFMEKESWDLAYPFLKEYTNRNPSNNIAIYNMGQICQILGKNEEALKYFNLLTERLPYDWRIIVKTIQLYQSTNQLSKRDEQREKLIHLLSSGINNQLSSANLYCREQLTVNGEHLSISEYFDLKGENPVRYSFLILDESKKNMKYKITLGSYKATNDISREIGDIKDGERLFHLDGYYPNGEHRTFAFFKNEPKYDDVRSLVINILNGKKKEISGTKLD